MPCGAAYLGSWARGQSGEGLCGELPAPIEPIWWRQMQLSLVCSLGEARLGTGLGGTAIGDI